MNDKPFHELTGPELNFQTSLEDAQMIAGIVQKVFTIIRDMTQAGRVPPATRELDPVTMQMDITVIHANQHPLDLRLMLYGGDEDMMHDVSAIVNNINRRIGRIPDGIRLRCKKEPGTVAH